MPKSNEQERRGRLPAAVAAYRSQGLPRAPPTTAPLVYKRFSSYSAPVFPTAACHTNKCPGTRREIYPRPIVVQAEQTTLHFRVSLSVLRRDLENVDPPRFSAHSSTALVLTCMPDQNRRIVCMSAADRTRGWPAAIALCSLVRQRVLKKTVGR